MASVQVRILRRARPDLAALTMDVIVEVCHLRGEREHSRSFHITGSIKLGDTANIRCVDCNGSGTWDHGPTEAECGPCVACKGTGRVWVALI